MLPQPAPYEVEWVEVRRIDKTPFDVLHKVDGSDESRLLPPKPSKSGESEF